MIAKPRRIETEANESWGLPPFFLWRTSCQKKISLAESGEKFNTRHLSKIYLIKDLFNQKASAELFANYTEIKK